MNKKSCGGKREDSGSGIFPCRRRKGRRPGNRDFFGKFPMLSNLENFAKADNTRCRRRGQEDFTFQKICFFSDLAIDFLGILVHNIQAETRVRGGVSSAERRPLGRRGPRAPLAGRVLPGGACRRRIRSRRVKNEFSVG